MTQTSNVIQFRPKQRVVTPTRVVKPAAEVEQKYKEFDNVINALCSKLFEDMHRVGIKIPASDKDVVPSIELIKESVKSLAFYCGKVHHPLQDYAKLQHDNTIVLSGKDGMQTLDQIFKEEEARLQPNIECLTFPDK